MAFTLCTNGLFLSSDGLSETPSVYIQEGSRVKNTQTNLFLEVDPVTLALVEGEAGHDVSLEGDLLVCNDMVVCNGLFLRNRFASAPMRISWTRSDVEPPRAPTPEPPRAPTPEPPRAEESSDEDVPVKRGAALIEESLHKCDCGSDCDDDCDCGCHD